MDVGSKVVLKRHQHLLNKEPWSGRVKGQKHLKSRNDVYKLVLIYFYSIGYATDHRESMEKKLILLDCTANHVV